MADVPPLARDAIALARAGDFEAALAQAKTALRDHPRDGGLQLFAGLLHARLLQVEEAVEHFRAAHALAPADPAPRLELVRALIGLGQLDEAEALLRTSALPPREFDRLTAALHIARGRFAEARPVLERLISLDPRDFESLNKLGSALLSLGEPERAANAFARSLELRREQPAIWDKWVDAMVAAGAGETALDQLARHDADQARVEARLLDRLDRPDDAVRRLEDRQTAGGADMATLVALAEMLERRNRIDDLEQLIGRIAERAPASEHLPLLRAKLALRRKDFAGARDAAQAAPMSIDPATRQQILGEANDRIGDHQPAWSAFVAMNQEDARANAGGRAEAEAYLAELERETLAMTDEWAERWTDPPPTAATMPIILLGFPRSGTTLLDTFLGAHPALSVSEEHPLLPTIAHAAGPVATVPDLSSERIAELRSLYWATATRFIPERGARRLVDKYPFGLVAGPYAERLFPGVPFLFVQRHPCDVVLSCYFTRFQPTGAPAAFAELEPTARLYDRMMRFWTRSRELLPLRVLDVRYERMVEDVPRELRMVAEFLDLEWTDALVENRAAAERRGHIRTPSYAQVAEPVYRRSVERWRNYRAELDPVLPLLEPWVRAFGYDL